jgi:hypothetical protein
VYRTDVREEVIVDEHIGRWRAESRDRRSALDRAGSALGHAIRSLLDITTLKSEQEVISRDARQVQERL